ncbi:MAG: nucleotide exchange factor GrpE [Flavobacteriales bacterium]|nr:nucleotide exchange factor GrpE [Flavobacteriales bacterium]
MEKEHQNKETTANFLDEMANQQLDTDNADTTADAPQAETAPQLTELEQLALDLETKQSEISVLNDKNLRLFAEFDNFRKRSAKEKLELLQMAGSGTITNLLPVLDDMDRASANNANVNDPEAVKQGMELIRHKFMNLLSAQGVKAMNAKGEPFDPELHEAITKAPAPSPDLKGKVLDVVENGYTMNDKVIRYAKVVVGE